MAASLGIAPDSEFRLQAALKYLFARRGRLGGTRVSPQGYLTQRCAQLLHVEEELVARQLQTLMLRRELIAGGTPEEPTAYLPQYDAAEREVAQRLMELMAALAPQQRLGVAQEIDRFERERNIRFSGMQRQAIAAALEQGVLVITGGPGTGKTTLINCMIRLCPGRRGGAVRAHGRAAKRMTEATALKPEPFTACWSMAGIGRFPPQSGKPHRKGIA